MQEWQPKWLSERVGYMEYNGMILENIPMSIWKKYVPSPLWGICSHIKMNDILWSKITKEVYEK